jgi:hypothetical protein
MTVMYRYVAIPFLLLLVGCAATGPSSSPEYPALVKSAVPPDAGPIVMFGPGDWVPNTVGFTDIRTLAYIPPISCVIVVTTTAVIVEQWDDRVKKFNVMKLLKLTDLTEVSSDTYGASMRLVLKSSDYSYNSFDLTDGSFADRSKTKEMAAYLQQHIPGPPPAK